MCHDCQTVRASNSITIWEILYKFNKRQFYRNYGTLHRNSRIDWNVKINALQAPINFNNRYTSATNAYQNEKNNRNKIENEILLHKIEI